eukprot:CAMPEP_0114581960 /NCGR_PEP_ID=MMETSP0125-20121206/6010_1 /TAXON_ID=485358 ORGANISM="Aristerostoma sp., Strain ATCC 50986" /NCGR_SAMPLE_ID=MMETSP0125 /ASSEMBLY_ACC=CAM_ASM_000245 /LENGTH=101 /DNA_ID=CAMNT_0001774573 /DNA_START=940 /DNA_END=1245 /DNA_ORIENTATION=+
MYKSLKSILEYDEVEELALDLNENKREYVTKFCYAMTTKEIEKQLTAFLKGFRTILPKAYIEHLSPADLDQIIRGLPEIDLAMLKKNFTYLGCTEKDLLVK